MDLVWHARILGAGNNSKQGAQQSRGLVGVGCPDLRDAGGISAVLRRQSLRDLREDPERQDRMAEAHGSHREGSD